LRAVHPGYGWERVVLVGHSLGGDSSALVARESPQSVVALITLDTRRSALPRTRSPRVLSIRASDTEADPGVLPTADEQQEFGSCIVRIAGSRHNDMYDGGSVARSRTE
jgi:pimeloyl-ACP methyl ester carboxylesterase